MKKLICLVMICLMILVLVGCAKAPIGEFVPTEDETETTARFREIGKEKINPSTSTSCIEDAYYYVDTETNIVYVYFIDWDAQATRGMLTVLYNADGTPMTLEEFTN